MDAINESIREKNPDVSIDELEGLFDDDEDDDDDEELDDEEAEDPDEEPVVPTESLKVYTTVDFSFPLKSAAERLNFEAAEEVTNRFINEGVSELEGGYTIEPKDNSLIAGVCIAKGDHHQTWKVVTDRQKILDCDNPIFLESEDSVEELYKRLSARAPDRIERKNYDKTEIIIWDRPVFTGPTNGGSDEEWQHWAMELKEKAIKHGSVLVEQSTIKSMNNKGFIVAISGFDLYHGAQIGLAAGGFVIDWRVASNKAIFHYDSARFDRLHKRRRSSEKSRKKKKVEDKKKGIRKIASSDLSLMCCFRRWLLYCLELEIPAFGRFRYNGVPGHGMPKTCKEVKELLEICNKLKVDFRKKYRRTSKYDYLADGHYLAFVRNMKPLTKAMREYKSKRTEQDMLDNITWLSKWIDREHTKAKKKK